MSSPKAGKAVYLGLLQEEKQGYEQLLGLLDQEWECLKRRDVTGLIGVTRAKEGLLEQIRETRRTVARWREQAGKNLPAPSRNRPDPEDPGVIRLQESLGRTQRQIQTQNDRNRRYLQESLKIIEEFFSLLALPGQAPPTYRRFENQGGAARSQSFISRRL